jgi:hypothetical protein
MKCEINHPLRSRGSGYHYYDRLFITVMSLWFLLLVPFEAEKSQML